MKDQTRLTWLFALQATMQTTRWAVSGSIQVAFLLRQRWKLDWMKPWRRASTGNPGSLAGPLLVRHTHFGSHLSDPAEPAGGPRAPPGRPSRLLHKKKTVACWVVQHAVSREIALRRSLDLRGLFPGCPLGQPGPPSLPPHMGPASNPQNSQQKYRRATAGELQHGKRRIMGMHAYPCAFVPRGQRHLRFGTTNITQHCFEQQKRCSTRNTRRWRHPLPVLKTNSIY